MFLDVHQQKILTSFMQRSGGIGLTGVILSAKFKLIPIKSQLINQEMIKFNNLDEFFEINNQSKNHTYTVAWIDCMTKGQKLAADII